MSTTKRYHITLVEVTVHSTDVDASSEQHAIEQARFDWQTLGDDAFSQENSRGRELITAREVRPCNTHFTLLATLDDLIGDRPDIQSGLCIGCVSCDYRDEPELEASECPSDDCPRASARRISTRVKAGDL